MLCAVCYGVLRGHQGSQWRGTFDLHFDHHSNRRELKDSADMSCCICRSLYSELERIEGKDMKSPVGIWNNVSSYLRRWIWGDQQQLKELDMKARKRFISAYLSEEYGLGQEGIYRLDFKLRDSERVGTFALQHVGDWANEPLHTPFSHDTSSDEVLVLAKEWIRTCTSQHELCRRPKDYKYPSRLIDLGEVINEERVDPEQVKLVLKKDLPEKGRPDRLYVTLSHCWGNAQFIRLTEDKVSEFQKGINMDALPKTFRDAIHFARRLGKDVRYIWIDSLCIIQGQREDWLAESARMYQIYNNSHCNISATAADNSEKGLYTQRVPHELWEDDINLNIEGIPGHNPGTNLGQTFGLLRKESIQRCRILDLSFWEKNVDEAPVNTRGWVLQERLMAPRVLHFCQGQIAWECREMVEAESSRGDVPIFRLKSGGVMERVGLKVANKGNNKIPTARIAENPQVDLHSRPTAYDDWKRVVEVYSRTRLTKPSDKLIALSGIAKMMSSQIKDEYQTEDRYIAGMWRKNLASQLLWRVDPVWENDRFDYRSTRPDVYRAPSFSWAAVDAEKGTGIKYGELTEDSDPSILIKVNDVKVTTETDNEFGLVTSGHLILSGIFQKIEMNVVDRNGMIRYEWHLVGMSAEGVPKPSTFSNVYLDSPSTDTNILGPNGHLYCVPAWRDSAEYLVCLLLQLERKAGNETGNFRRVGLTKVPPYDKSGQKRVELPSGEEVPYGPWDAVTRLHTVRIV